MNPAEDEGAGALPPGVRAPSDALSCWAVVGGAGFIGSHVVGRLLDDTQVERVTVYDNFSSGREQNLKPHLGERRLEVISGDAEDMDRLCPAIAGHDVVVHLASNPDIAAAATDPALDFRQGTVLTQSVCEAVRRSGVDRLLYASGSGVYGDLGELQAAENYGPLEPVSTYGASKLAGEALLSAYSSMFGLKTTALRLANVVGPRQAHGVAFDFVHRLLDDPTALRVLGDGHQSKSYVHVSDVVEAMMLVASSQAEAHSVYNVATEDYLTVTEIARLVLAALGLDLSTVRFDYAGGKRGWKGDVPVVRLTTEKIRGLGWKSRFTSREAIELAVRSMLTEALAGRSQ